LYGSQHGYLRRLSGEKMSLESDIAKTFEDNHWMWHFKDNQWRIPTENDVQDALDEAARMLYNEDAGAQLQVGRLIIVKKEIGHDVYVFAGPYQ
jgi:hypothetical protein